MNILKDYDMSVLYHPDKANVVANALSRTTMSSVSHIDEAKKDLVKHIHRLARLGVRLEDSRIMVCLFDITPSHLWWLR